MTPRLDAIGVGFAFGDRAVLAGVDVAVEPGMLVAVVGPNGSGKTTLLKTLAGIAVPSAGVVRLDGRPLAELGRRAVARRLALVPQDPRVDYAFTALEVVLMGRAPHQHGLGLPSGRDVAIAERALEWVDAGALAGRSVDRLSGGERQRIFVARALAQEPAVLLLDEPTTHLDVRHQLDVHELLRHRCRSEGLAAVAVVHDLNVALAYADRVLVLAEGRAVATGAPASVLTVERIAAVFGVAMDRVAAAGDGAPALVARGTTRGPFARPGGAC